MKTTQRQHIKLRPTGIIEASRSSMPVAAVWVAFVVAAILSLDVFEHRLYGVVILAAAAAAGVATVFVARPSTRRLGWTRRRLDGRDLLVIAGLYVTVVGLFRVAFTVFTVEQTAGLFLSFAAALVIGLAGPVVYTVWIRGRRLASLGIGLHNLARTLVLGLLFAGVQFLVTLWGYDLPRPVDWIPLLVMALVVGIFESVFFRGFIQGRLEAMIGTGPAVFGGALLYALYHVGYGMDAEEMLFLLGLGVVYAIAYRLTENVLVLWPLLTPLGSFFAQLQAGDLAGELPWASVAGFGDVLALMAAVIWLAHRHERRLSMDRTRTGPAIMPFGPRIPGPMPPGRRPYA